MNKPTVHFVGEVKIHRGQGPFTHEKFRYATIAQVLDHPRLGRQPWVRTSVIKRVNKALTRIETLNTIYVKVAE